MTALARRHRLEVTPATAIAATLTLALSLAILLLARWGPDWPAQEFRAWVAAHDGLSVWTSRWYGGSALPGYSVLYPLVAGPFGAGPTGLLASVATAWAASGLAPADPRRARLFGVTVAVCLAQILLIGQVPFLLGTMFAVMAVRSLLAGRHWAATATLAVLSSLGSPLAGAFLLLCLPALAVATSRRRSLALLGALVGSLVSYVVGGADGPFPCQWQSMVAIVVFAGAVFWLGPRTNRALRVFALCYGGAAIAVFLIPNPIGGNIGRLGKLVAVPIACHYLSATGTWPKIRAVVATSLAILWPSVPFTTAIARGADDPSQHASFYVGLNRFLRTQNPSVGRLEIPFTREHWEALWVARRFPIARGWERQSDLLYNRVLYRATLSAGQYRHWLYRNAVSLVALPRAPIDYGGRAEAALLAHPHKYLKPIWHDTNWTVWRVVGSPTLVTGPATVTDLDPSSIGLRFHHVGTAEVRVRASSLWEVTSGQACLDSTRDGWLVIRAARAGPVQLTARLNDQLVTGSGDCDSPPR
jgi:hypothetical protein